MIFCVIRYQKEKDRTILIVHPLLKKGEVRMGIAGMNVKK
jgi:hypothetical protein